MNSELRTKLEACARTAEEFTRLYYATIDTRRHRICSLYIENAIFVWNGNAAIGREQINKCFIELLPSRHNLSTLDAQPILLEELKEQKTHMIFAAGSVRYADKPLRYFQQIFIITLENEKWKIVRDCYRLQDSMFLT